MYEVLKAILVEDLHMRAEDVRPTASRAEVGLDSLAAVELAAALNSRLGIAVQDYEVLEAVTVADVVRLMEQRRSGSGPLGSGPLEAP
ncbi:acyl carrier protein [Polymorphospora rubra]|uniref:Carrier domain-containing protein n=1 Tax=Polymorphospora rubra TaxID=338584 RepID=A0A810N7T2_9ACTN|nr:acyl carrier protein [Polymorphospora rubra]BCJ69317.1 hypothetical protein Prubr_63380 [Polymorphospora rubra]